MDAPRRLFMNRLSEDLARETGMDHRGAQKCVKAFFEGVAEALEEGETVTLRGFGSFKPVWLKDRHGRNPQTGAAIVTPAHYTAHFSPSRALADRVNAECLHLSDPPAARRGRRPLAWPAIGVVGSLAAGAALYVGAQRSIQPETTADAIPPDQDGPAVTATATPPETRLEASQPPTDTPIIEGVTAEESPAEEITAAAELPEPSPPAPTPVVYTVRPGDSLWSIADEQWGNPGLWPVLYTYNREGIADPHRIYPGQQLQIPPDATRI